MSRAAIPILTSIAPLVAGCEAWIVDLWGVIHNGVAAHERAVAACRTFRAQGGVAMLLSNAPRPFTAVAEQLDRLGVAREAYDGGVTSGDVARALIAAEWQGRGLLHIGPERDRGLFAGLDVAFAAPEAAEAIVCSGLYDDTRETPADYAGLLAQLAARNVPMICANPDLIVERGKDLVYCAGALAADYERRGGTVVYTGKPHLPIYERTLAAIAECKGRLVARASVLAIGDGIETDLLGAHRAGLRSVFIASAVHVSGGLAPAVLEELFAARAFAPVAALPALAW
jgi:HAD superfamily hydrolase (TIGR01459 family)